MMISLIKQTTEYLNFGKGDQLIETMSQQGWRTDPRFWPTNWLKLANSTFLQSKARDDCKGWTLFKERGIFLPQMECTDLELKECRESSDAQHKKTKHLPTLSERKLSGNDSGKTSGKPMSWFLKPRVRQFLECSLADNFCKRSPERGAVFC